MDEFYNILYKDIFYLWIQANSTNYALVSKKRYNEIIYTTPYLKGSIKFYHNGIVEEEIENEDNANIFYLHYEIRNFKQCTALFKDYYNFLINYKPNKKIKILLCCSGGLTTSLFAMKLQELAELLSYPLTIEARGVHLLTTVYKEYKACFLAPQVAYMEPMMVKLTNRTLPIKSIDTVAFATNQYYQVIEYIMSILKENSIV